MSELNIEIGKKYVNFFGDICEIIKEVEENTEAYEEGYRFKDSKGRIYSQDGRFDIHGGSLALNLKYEIKPHCASDFNLEVGNFYITRDGKRTVRVMYEKINPSDAFKLLGSDGNAYRQDGRVLSDVITRDDLVKEVTSACNLVQTFLTAVGGVNTSTVETPHNEVLECSNESWVSQSSSDKDNTPEGTIRRAVALAKRMEEMNEFGALHIVVSDGNIEDDHIEFCLKQSNITPEEREFANDFLYEQEGIRGFVYWMTETSGAIDMMTSLLSTSSPRAE